MYQQNCPDCKQIMTPGHRAKEHPPKEYIKTAQNTYLDHLKEKGYVWDDKEKQWVKEAEELSALQ